MAMKKGQILLLILFLVFSMLLSGFAVCAEDLIQESPVIPGEGDPVIIGLDEQDRPGKDPGGENPILPDMPAVQSALLLCPSRQKKRTGRWFSMRKAV